MYIGPSVGIFQISSWNSTSIKQPAPAMPNACTIWISIQKLQIKHKICIVCTHGVSFINFSLSKARSEFLLAIAIKPSFFAVCQHMTTINISHCAIKCTKWVEFLFNVAFQPIGLDRPFKKRLNFPRMLLPTQLSTSLVPNVEKMSSKTKM